MSQSMHRNNNSGLRPTSVGLRRMIVTIGMCLMVLPVNAPAYPSFSVGCLSANCSLKSAVFASSTPFRPRQYTPLPEFEPFADTRIPCFVPDAPNDLKRMGILEGYPPVEVHARKRFESCYAPSPPEAWRSLLRALATDDEDAMSRLMTFDCFMAEVQGHLRFKRLSDRPSVRIKAYHKLAVLWRGSKVEGWPPAPGVPVSPWTGTVTSKNVHSDIRSHILPSRVTMESLGARWVITDIGY